MSPSGSFSDWREQTRKLFAAASGSAIDDEEQFPMLSPEALAVSLFGVSSAAAATAQATISSTTAMSPSGGASGFDEWCPMPSLEAPPSFYDEWVRDLFVEPLSLSVVSGDDLRPREPRSKRTRSKNWRPEEKQAYLQLKAEALRTVKGKPWDFISRGLRDRHGFERDPKCCEDLWSTFLRGHRAIQQHEAASQSDPLRFSYWDMDEPARSHRKLPRLFLQEWWTMIDGIVTAPARGPRTRPRITDPGEHSAGNSAIFEETEFDVAPLLPSIKRDIDHEVNSALETLLCRETSGAATQQEKLLRSIAPLIKQQVEAAVTIDLKVLALDIVGGDFRTHLAPFVRNCIKDALGSAVPRLSAALQDLAQKEQEDRERLRAIEEHRQALDLEEMQITAKRRRANPHQRPRGTCNKRRGGTPPLGSAQHWKD